MSLGPMQIVLILVVVLLFFGRGKISELMGDFGKGINSFKRGLNDDQADKVENDEARADHAKDVTPGAETAASKDRDSGSSA